MFRRHLIVVVIVLAAMMARQVSAGVGAHVAFPVPGARYSRTSGLQLELISNWVESPGYRPLYVRLTSLRPNRADRTLTITVVPNDWTPSRQGVQFDITLPEGTMSITKEVPVPQIGIWNQVQVESSEDGQNVEDLSGEIGIPRNVTTWSWTEAYPAMLFIDGDAPVPTRINSILSSSTADGVEQLPDISAVASLMPPFDDYAQGLGAGGALGPNRHVRRERGDDQDTLTIVQRLQTIALLPFSELPTNWLGYTSLDLIFISLADLRAMSEEHPDRLTALRRYVVNGGNLIVTGVGTNPSGLIEIDEIVDVDGDDRVVTDQQDLGALDRWRELDESKFGPGLAEIAAPTGVVRTYNRTGPAVDEVLTEDDGDDPYEPEDEGVPDGSMFRWCEVGWGRVVALAPDELREASNAQWGWMLNDVGHDRWRWYRRHGLSRQRENQAFWSFLIPGVGAAPVRVFLALITGFVLIIGPANFILLKRARRLYLLLVTVPLAAALVIAGLFGFAVVKDGLGTRARLRSYSEYFPDGRVVTWSRQSYYAGLTPSAGLIYPVDAAVYPIDPLPMQRKFRRRLTKWGDNQRLAAGFLSPRTTSQNLVVRTLRHQQPLKIERSGPAPPQVTNEGLVTIDQLMIRDGADAFWATAIEPGGTVTADELSAAAARDRYTELLREHRPSTPQGFTAPRSRGFNRYYYNNFDSGVAAPTFETNLMESCMGRPIFDDSSTKRLYYAIMQAAPQVVPIGVESSEQEAGFHVIQGYW